MKDGNNLLTKTQKQGYIKVETSGLMCSPIDKRVINRLKYKRAYITYPTEWMGYSNLTKGYTPLSQTWVVKNFPKPYIKQVKVSTGRSTSYIRIPPGDCRTHAEQTDMKSPPVHYQQKENERTCMVYSMASILHYSGDTSAGAWIRNRAKRYLHDPSAFRMFVKDVRHHIRDRNNPSHTLVVKHGIFTG